MTAEDEVQADGCGIEVTCSQGVVEEICRRAVEGFNAFGHGGLEIGGVLYGRREHGRLRVLAHAEIPCEHALGPGFVLSENDRTEFRELLQAKDGLEPLGWYASHARSEVAITENDQAIFDAFFPMAGAAALVLKPARDGSAQAAFVVRERNGVLRAGKEFEIHPGARAPAAIAPVRDTPPMQDAPRKPDTPPEDSAGAPRKSWPYWRYWPVALAIVVAAVGAYLARPRNLGLEAVAVAPRQIRIQWDRGIQAPSGVLEIDDGRSHYRLPLNADQLASSGVTYERHSKEVVVRLRAGSREQSVIFTGPAIAERGIAEQPIPAHADGSPAPLPEPTVVGNTGAIAVPEPAVIGKATTTAPPGLVVASEKPGPVLSAATPVTPKAGETEPRERAKPIAFRPPVMPRPQQIAIPAPPTVSLSPLAERLSIPLGASVNPGPRSGRLIWTGDLKRGGVIEIDDGHASVGTLNGPLPGIAVRLQIWPAEFGTRGLVAYTSDPSKDGRTEAASRANGWNPMRFEWNPARARQIAVLEAPNPSNGFTRLVLRNDARACSMVVIEWTLR